MDNPTRKFFKSCLALALLAGCLSTVIHSQAAGSNPNQHLLSIPAGNWELDFSQYKSWHKVNPKPQQIPSYVAMLCRAPSRDVMEAERKNPHNDKYLTVYVNETGKHAMFQEAKPSFPLRTVIVKEKLPSADSTTPELLTVMVKKEPGFNPECGDWEFFVMDGAGTKLQARGKIESCQSCHRLQKDQDFLYRLRYLPDDIREKLVKRSTAR